MSNLSINDVVEHLCARANAGTLADLPDGQLLERFVNHWDEAAFAVLLRRHGAMVLRAG